MSGKIFNTYKNRYGQNIPKTAIIENSEEVRLYLKNNYSGIYENSLNNIHEDRPWLSVAIAASHAGNIFMHIFTETDEAIGRYNPSMVKDFIDFEAFKKYLNWAFKLPNYIVNKK